MILLNNAQLEKFTWFPHLYTYVEAVADPVNQSPIVLCWYCYDIFTS